MQYLDDNWVEKDNKIVGQRFKNKYEHSFIVLNYYLNSSKNSKKVKVKFDSGFEMITTVSAIRTGSVIDRLSPTVSSVGCIGYASMKDNPKEYHKWKAMLKRCYVESDKSYYRYGGKGVVVCDRWLRFDYYLEDIPLIEGFDLGLYNEGKLVLDKDIKAKGDMKIYSPDACKFVTVAENTKFSATGAKGKKIKVLNLSDNNIQSFDKISDFCKLYNLDRHMVMKNTNTNLAYKNFKIYLEGYLYETI